ncbi:acyltransferase family protein [Sphingobium sp. CR28]|uniref:acyltransferase family protein n=1 Tax=Sphingobium sp. CR28 TaxID=3400272 RepID=UPI003FEECC78
MSSVDVKPGMRMPHLDALRAFACLLVVFEHYSGLSDQIPIGSGMLGVGLFYVLSGFLITSNLLRDTEAGMTRGNLLKKFYIRRFFRLFPAYYAILIVLIVLGIGPIRDAWLYYFTYTANFQMAAGGARNVFWSLCVEEQFYTFWPLILLCGNKKSWLWLALSLIVISLMYKFGSVAIGSRPRFLLLPHQLSLLGAGCVLAVISFRGGRPFDFGWYSSRLKSLNLIVGLVGFSGALLLWVIVGQKSIYRDLFNDFLVLPLMIWFIMNAAIGFKSEVLKRIFGNSALQYLGQISYGIYMVHNWIPKISDRYLGIDGILKLIFCVAATLLICSLSWKFFERPLLLFGHRLAKGADDRSSQEKDSFAVKRPA